MTASTSTDLIPTTIEHQHLVALSPTEVPGAQAELADWCRRKVITLGAELREQRANLRQAKLMKWRHRGWERMVSSTKRRMLYYVKIRQAVQAGYLIIPNFDLELLAVRVARSTPRFKIGTYPSDVNKAKSELLAPGEGRYVDETTSHYDISRRDSAGKLLERQSRVGEYDDEVDFPFLTIKPVILEATARAMALKVFDQIGIAHGGTVSARSRRADPLVVGQILDPRSTRYNKKLVSFFVAWWFDTEVLA